MKKKILHFSCAIFVILLISIIAFASKASKSSNTANNDNPDVLYRQDHSIDLLVYNDTAYVNATDIDWVTELELKSNKKLGEIERTSVTRKFRNYDATILEVGTEIFSVIGRNDIVLVSIDKVMVPYFAFVEG